MLEGRGNGMAQEEAKQNRENVAMIRDDDNAHTTDG